MSSVGEIYTNVTEGALFNADINGGVGKTENNLPRGVAVPVIATRGIGGSDDNQIWETQNYDDATSRITIDYSGGVGELVIR